MDILNLIKDHVHPEPHEQGATILQAGQDSGYMYVIQEGELDVVIAGELVRVLKQGDLFGEMSLIDGSPHSADIIARTDCILIPIDERRFLFLIHENPLFALHVMRLMAQRLRS